MRAVETVHAENSDFVYSPNYRMNFWQQPPPEPGWNLDAFVLTEAEGITEVLRWVEAHARERRFEVFAESHEEPVGAFESPRKAGPIRLLGSNPNAGEPVEVGRFDQRDTNPRE